ncbi:MAG: GH92 family glycosyl hydrolase [Muribaculum sp.]|nr:GH92 family glycosyl hydrolase [Muribaculum sp.]
MKLRNIATFIMIAVTSAAVARDAVDYVNPMIGATTADERGRGGWDELGKTFPGVCTPFGLVQISPDTHTGGDNGPGYSYHHKTIEGFSLTHMSGIGWYGDLGNFLVTPTIGPLHTFKGTDDDPDGGYRSRYSHDTEDARIDCYSVVLDDYGIKAELTAAPRSGMMRFTYPEADTARIQIDLARRIGGTSTRQMVKVVDDHTIQGWMRCTPDGGGWGDGAGGGNYTVYFYCVFDRPLLDYGVWSASIPDGVDRHNSSNDNPAYHELIKNAEVSRNVSEAEGSHLGFFVEFPTRRGDTATVKTGVSFVSIDGARRNLESDIDGWDFDKVRARTRQLWSDALSKIAVEGHDEAKTIFYTALYHTMIDPRCFSDVDGSYPGADGCVHQADGFVYRTIFSGWDVFRSQFPLQTIINPRMVCDEINSFIQMADLSGRKYFPRWEFLNSYSGCMIGNPAVSVVADAYNKGLRDYDVNRAIEYAINTVRKFSNNDAGWTPGSLSETLEYCYTDWCVASMLHSMGRHDEAGEFDTKSKAYRTVWNDSVGWFRTRQADGSWLPWQGRTVLGQGCAESNYYQQGWFVPHDIDGLKALMGGDDVYERELVAFFDGADERFRWGDYYNHPNEPDHHVPFMLNYTSRPWLTQYWTRRICNNAYGTDVYGLCGNEDVGQMSAWYILAAMGFHPVCPGTDRYEITSPVFDRVEISLDSDYYPGRKFIVIAHGNSPENVYIKSLRLNGESLDRLWITHSEITDGGILEMEMSSILPPNVKGLSTVVFYPEFVK